MGIPAPGAEVAVTIQRLTNIGRGTGSVVVKTSGDVTASQSVQIDIDFVSSSNPEQIETGVIAKLGRSNSGRITIQVGSKSVTTSYTISYAGMIQALGGLKDPSAAAAQVAKVLKDEWEGKGNGWGGKDPKKYPQFYTNLDSHRVPKYVEMINVAQQMDHAQRAQLKSTIMSVQLSIIGAMEKTSGWGKRRAKKRNKARVEFLKHIQSL